MTLPQLPVSHQDFIAYVAKTPDIPVRELVQPFNDYESSLRELFAQSHDEAIEDPFINAIPIYAGHEEKLTIQARDPDNDEENSKYIMPLRKGARMPNGSPAVVETLSRFKKNFNLFSESSLADLDWHNVVVAGSAVVTSLLPVSEEHKKSTRALRTYYHDKIAPSSDVDLFLWGLTEEQAVEKIKDIETSVKNSILAETTTIRTKFAVTIASQYPTRHVQIVLRRYKSISEILTGFDVDSSCFAYDGSQVYGTPRGIAAFLTQCNIIDLSRRSPSYENRLAKYATRGFEIFCSDLDRERVDATIYDRSFARVQGLARLLVLERLPKESDRDNYRDRRRHERARPAFVQGQKQHVKKLRDNFKDKDPQDVAEWVMQDQDDVSNYHSFTIPYGPRYNAKKIEKLVYTKDLLLNAEWNSKKNRTVNLHRHPCFVGDFDFITTDCCTTCPQPVTQEEREIAEEESKKYVSGNIEFIRDDPGRQSIGSFHPLTSADWTQQAYLGELEPLCQAIVDGNQKFVQEWCKSVDVKDDHRDHTGRTPLHLACLIGKVEIVQILVDAGARLVSRLADGLTPLHIACIRGDVQIINILLEKSEANEEIEEETAEAKRKKHGKQSSIEATSQPSYDSQAGSGGTTSESNHESIEVIDNTDVESDNMSMTQGSFVKVPSPNGDEETAIDKESEGPDVYDINILAWDNPITPLHLAIICGHTEAVRLLVSNFGADVLLPVKLLDHSTSGRSDVIMTLTLAARSTEKSMDLTKLLLDLGASPSQSDSKQTSALLSVALTENIEALKVMVSRDMPRSQTALKYISVRHISSWNVVTKTPLTAALFGHSEKAARALLEAGAPPNIEYDEWAKAYMMAAPPTTRPNKTTIYESFGQVEQPIILAAQKGFPDVVELLLEKGADMNQLDVRGFGLVNKSGPMFPFQVGATLLDIVVPKTRTPLDLTQSIAEMDPPSLLSQDQYTHGHAKDSYQYWQLQNQYAVAEELLKNWDTLTGDMMQFLSKSRNVSPTFKVESTKAQSNRETFERVRGRLIAEGAKTFAELHPELPGTVLSTADETKKIESETLGLEIEFMVPSVHDTNKNGYAQLFEAAWCGDKEKIISLTCKPDQDGNVLRIAVHDNMSISPFHIAIWRGEYDVAELMLEIADIQYAPDAKDGAVKRRYHIRSAFSDNYSDDSDDEDDFYVSSEIVDQEVTVDDIARLAQQVGSKSQAIDLLSWQGQFWMFNSLSETHGSTGSQPSSRHDWRTLSQKWFQKQTSLALFQSQFEEISASNKVDILEFAINAGNGDLVDRVVRWVARYHASTTKTHQSSNASQRLNLGNRRYVFQALRLGHFGLASKLVTQFGAGIPIQTFIDEAGIPDSEASKYYQGLLLRGKHRKDWNQKANKTAHIENSQDTLRTSLLLHAVASEGVAVIEWCLSDTPQRLLVEYLSHSKDQRVKELMTASGKPDAIVKEWLDSRRSIALHMAVLSNRWHSDVPGERAQAVEVLKYLTRVVPEGLETKNATGYTPLALAFWTRRAQAAAILIEAGADQTVRDFDGANIFHLAVNKIGKWSEQDARELGQCLALIDRDIVGSLSTERCSFGPTGMNPLATWLWRLPVHLNGPSTTEEDELETSVLEILLKHMDEEALCMIDGSGQMPIHSCMRRNSIGLLELLCARYPKLILLENGMGQTAIELCYSVFIQEAVHPSNRSAAVTYVPPGEWQNRNPRDIREPIAHDKALAILRETDAKHGVEKGRVLISSLHSAEVSKRLADIETKTRKPMEQAEPPKDRDEVERWLKNNDYSVGYVPCWKI